jgi:hypothetical protein
LRLAAKSSPLELRRWREAGGSAFRWLSPEKIR